MNSEHQNRLIGLIALLPLKYSKLKGFVANWKAELREHIAAEREGRAELEVETALAAMNSLTPCSRHATKPRQLDNSKQWWARRVIDAMQAKLLQVAGERELLAWERIKDWFKSGLCA
jgi:hypothetical protein